MTDARKNLEDAIKNVRGYLDGRRDLRARALYEDMNRVLAAAERILSAPLFESGVPIGPAIPARSSEVKQITKMKPGDSLPVADRETAHRLRVYISRHFGTGAGVMRREIEGYRVWRVK